MKLSKELLDKIKKLPKNCKIAIFARNSEGMHVFHDELYIDDVQSIILASYWTIIDFLEQDNNKHQFLNYYKQIMESLIDIVKDRFTAEDLVESKEIIDDLFWNRKYTRH